MYGLGTIINVGAIIIGGLIGILFGRFIKDRHRDALCIACGLAVIFIGAVGAFKGMFSIVDGTITYGGDFLIIICLALGALVGEIINIEGGFEKFGEWLKKKTKSTKDNYFISGFVTASFTLPCDELRADEKKFNALIRPIFLPFFLCLRTFVPFSKKRNLKVPEPFLLVPIMCTFALSPFLSAE